MSVTTSDAASSPSPTGLHQIVIVGGGAGGLELATRLGDKLGKRGRAAITLIDKTRSHVWKPKLHEIAAGSMGLGRGVRVGVGGVAVGARQHPLRLGTSM